MYHRTPCDIFDFLQNDYYKYDDVLLTRRPEFRASINRSFGQLIETRAVNTFARQLACDGSIIKRVSCSYPTHTLTRVRARRLRARER